jgi:hypothetical protein
MKINKRFSGWEFSDGHPQSYHAAAIVLAVIALGTVIATVAFAEGDAISTTGTTAGVLTTNTAIEAPECEYAYSDWNVCQSNGKRYRFVTGMSPSNCIQRNSPSVEDSCQYINTSTISNSTSTSTSTSTSASISQSRDSSVHATAAIQCEYAYSNWGRCQSNGIRTRTFLSKSPSGCEEYTRPVLNQSCIYDPISIPQVTMNTRDAASDISSTTVSESSNTDRIQSQNSDNSSTGIMPIFSFLNVADGMIIRGEFEIKGMVRGAKEVSYYLVPIGSNTPKYIGIGSQVSDNEWRLKFRSKNFPNGEFYLRAKIKNTYGEYIGGQRKIRIINEEQATTMTNSSGEIITMFAMNDDDKKMVLQQVENELQIPQDTTLNAETKTLNQKRKYVVDYCQSKPETCHSERDTDKDGLNDIDEIRYGTDPYSADSDFDGFIDGDEVKNGFDPSKYSAGDKSDRIVFEDPKTSGRIRKEVYSVQSVDLKDTETGGKSLHFTGKGLPNSFVTIYVYSDPIVLTVKTDSDGNWTYDLDKELEDGTHEAYVAITDNTGKITAKSEPIAFVKTAQAATIIPSVQAAPITETLPVTKHRTQRDMFFLVAIIIAAIAFALATIGLMKHKRGVAKEQSPQL